MVIKKTIVFLSLHAPIWASFVLIVLCLLLLYAQSLNILVEYLNLRLEVTFNSGLRDWQRLVHTGLYTCLSKNSRQVYKFSRIKDKTGPQNRSTKPPPWALVFCLAQYQDPKLMEVVSIRAPSLGQCHHMHGSASKVISSNLLLFSFLFLIPKHTFQL